jgi:hypothetical protein
LISKERDEALVGGSKRIRARAGDDENAKEMLLAFHRHPERGMNRRVNRNPAWIRRNIG